MKITTIMIGLAAMAASLTAGTINFAGGGSLGGSHTFGLVTASAYLSNVPTSPNAPNGTLFGKGTANGTGSEDGLGLTADHTGDDEIFAKWGNGYPASDFIQLDITNLTGTIQISMS